MRRRVPPERPAATEPPKPFEVTVDPTDYMLEGQAAEDRYQRERMRKVTTQVRGLCDEVLRRLDAPVPLPELQLFEAGEVGLIVTEFLMSLGSLARVRYLRLPYDSPFLFRRPTDSTGSLPRRPRRR